MCLTCGCCLPDKPQNLNNRHGDGRHLTLNDHQGGRRAFKPAAKAAGITTAQAKANLRKTMDTFREGKKSGPKPKKS